MSHPVRASALRLTRASRSEAAAWVRGHGAKVVQTPVGLALRHGKPPMDGILGDRIALVGGSFVVVGRSA